MNHPGVIVFEDHDRETSREKSVSEVPDAIAFAKVDGKRIPVVRVVTVVQGNRRYIRSFGADGRLLATTVGSRR